jgi:hypothetical protein
MKMKWITREDLRVDRVACPWLVQKFSAPTSAFARCSASACSSSQLPLPRAFSLREGGVPFVSLTSPRIAAEPAVRDAPVAVAHDVRRRELVPPATPQ